MKKHFVLFATIALAALALIGCENQVQPLSGVPKPNETVGAPAVPGDKIVAEAFLGFNLIHWDSTDEAAGYIIYRREAEKPGTTLKLAGALATMSAAPTDGATYTAGKKIPYYIDDKVINGAVYQYGIATYNYKSTGSSQAVSDIIWGGGGNITATSPGVGEEFPLPTTWPAATISQYSIAKPASGSTNVDYCERVKAVISNISPNYEYTFKAQKVTNANPDESDWNSGAQGTLNTALAAAFTHTEVIDVYLDNNGVYTISGVDLDFGWADAASGSYSNHAGRFIVEVSENSYTKAKIITQAATSPAVLNNKQKTICEPFFPRTVNN